MKSLITKSLLPVMVAAFVVFPFSRVSADTDKPKVRSVQSVMTRSLVLPITWDQYNKSVDTKVKVRITDKATGAVMFQLFDTRFNGNGHGKVTLTGLKPGTDYAFKVKVRKITLKDYSPYSRTKNAMTAKAAPVAASASTSPDNAGSQ